MNSSLGIHLLLRAAAVGGAGLLQLVPEGTEHLVQGGPAGPVVALEEPVVEVVVLVRLEVVLPPAVRGGGADQEVDAVPHEGEGGGVDEEGGTEAAEVVEVLQGVHAQPRERFNVGVAVVEAVDVFVESRDVDESAG